MFAGCFVILATDAWTAEFNFYFFALLGVSFMMGGTAELLPLGRIKAAAALRINEIAFASPAMRLATLDFPTYT